MQDINESAGDQSVPKSKSNFSLLIRILLGFLLSSALFTCMAFQHWTYARKLKELLPNLILLPLGGIGLFLLSCLIWRFVPKSGTKKRAVIILCAALFLYQLISAYSYYFLTGWDAMVIREMSLAFARGDRVLMESWKEYFSIYPNNAMIVVLLGAVTKLADLMHLPRIDYFAQIAFQCFLNTLTGFMFFFLIRKVLRDDRAAAAGFMIYVLLIGLSPWVSIPYSDSIALIFPVSVLLLYFLEQTAPLLNLVRWFGIFFLSFLGYYIKPQTMIVLIAIILVGILRRIRARALLKPDLKHILGAACACALGALLALSLAFAARKALFPDLNPERALGPSHFLMMGLNQKRNGSWLKKDVQFSMSRVSKKGRIEDELRVAKERLTEMGAAGLLAHAVRKTLTNYSDGSFTWGKEGEFFYETFDDATILSRPLKAVFCEPKAAPYKVWVNLLQALWMAVLFFSLVSVFTGMRQYAVFRLSVVGIMLFELLFEARARYFFHFAPVIILLAAKGIRDLHKSRSIFLGEGK